MFPKVRNFYYINLILYLPFLPCLYNELIRNRDDLSDEHINFNLDWFFIFMWTFRFMVTEGIQLRYERFKYFGSTDNLIEST